MSKGTKLLAQLNEVLGQINKYEDGTENSISDFTSFVEEVKTSLSNCDISAATKAKADAEAEETARLAAEAAEAVAEEEFVKYLNQNGFAAFYGKGGKIACKLDASLKNDAEQEANTLFGHIQVQSEKCSFNAEEFKSELYNYEYNDVNRYALIVFLNIKGGIKLQNFGGKEVGTYFK